MPTRSTLHLISYRPSDFSLVTATPSSHLTTYSISPRPPPHPPPPSFSHFNLAHHATALRPRLVNLASPEPKSKRACEKVIYNVRVAVEVAILERRVPGKLKLNAKLCVFFFFFAGWFPCLELEFAEPL